MRIITAAGRGARAGLVFAFLELFLGCGLWEGLGANPARMPPLLFVALVLGGDLALGAAMGILVELARFRPAQPGRRDTVSYGPIVALLGGLFLLSVVIERGRTVPSLWNSYRLALACGTGLYTVAVLVICGFVERRLAARWPDSSRRWVPELFCLLGYYPSWLLLSAIDTVQGEAPFPWAGTLLALLPASIAVLSGLGALRLGRRGSSPGTALGAFAAVLLVAVPLWRSPDVPSFPPALPPDGRGAVSAKGPSPVILIVLDTLRADHLGCYGYGRDTSPRIDQFASRATIFDRCISPSPWTAPAHASLFTGLFPRTHGVHLSGTSGEWPERLLPLADEQITLAEHLRAAGYVTAGLSANAWVSTEYGFDQGFDVFYDALPQAVAIRPLLYNLASSLPPEGRVARALAPAADWVVNRTEAQFKPYITFPVMQDAISRWLPEMGGRRFFIFLNVMETHDPYEPPPAYARRWPGRLNRRVPFHQLRTDVMAGRRVIEPEILRHLVSQYDGEISALDQRLGELFDSLRRAGLFDEAWIIVTSDHGEHFGEHGLLWHRNSLYQPLIHVPLIVKRPGQQRGERVERLVQLNDILPTLLAENGVAGGDGGQVGGLWGGRDAAFAELYCDSWIAETHGEKWRRDLLAYISGGMKLIQGTDGSAELYRLEVDPAERVNLADRTNAGASVREGLDAFLADHPMVFPVGIGEDRETDSRARELLRSLGYLD